LQVVVLWSDNSRSWNARCRIKNVNAPRDFARYFAAAGLIGTDEMIMLYNLLFMGLAIAALGFAAGGVFWLLWALIARRGERRMRWLRLAASSAVLCVVSVTASVSMYYLLFPRIFMATGEPGFHVPYAPVSDVLWVVVPVLLYTSAILLIRTMWVSGAARRRSVLATTGGLLFTVSAYTACYALIHSVQVPAYERFMMIEYRDWKTHVGDPAPDITVAMLDGSTKRLSELRGKLVVLNFFATWCGPCNYELPHLQTLWADLKDNDGVAMLVIDREEDADTVTAFLAKHGFTFPVALDPEATAFKQFADEGVPRTYLIDRDGKILFQTLGFAKDSPIYERELATLRRTIASELASAR